MIVRAPRAGLRPFVTQVWASRETDLGAEAPVSREHALPTGAMHLVFRIGPPLRIFDSARDATGRVLGHAIVGGARTAHYIRDVAAPALSVGAMLRPGASAALLGAPADAFAQTHTALGDIWGSAASLLHERLCEAGSPAERLSIFEATLLERLPPVRGLHPAVAHALEHMDGGAVIEALVRDSGYSHRFFNEQFRRAVGLTPKAYARILRFQAALELAHAGAEFVTVALAAGYSDQAHFNRDFYAFTGMTPGAYRIARPIARNHVRAPSER